MGNVLKEKGLHLCLGMQKSKMGGGAGSKRMWGWGP